jgi:glycosyltransferase involved in cell wall biosynthesis
VQSILDLHDGRSVFVYPNVPDVAPFVQSAILSVVPLRVGGGTRIKILESLALGTPVVSTTIGAEGLNVKHSEHLLLADGAEAFADAILSALWDPALRDRLARAGRHCVEHEYLWSSVRHRVSYLAERWLAAQRQIAA